MKLSSPIRRQRLVGRLARNESPEESAGRHAPPASRCPYTGQALVDDWRAVGKEPTKALPDAIRLASSLAAASLPGAAAVQAPAIRWLRATLPRPPWPVSRLNNRFGGRNMNQRRARRCTHSTQSQCRRELTASVDFIDGYDLMVIVGALIFLNPEFHLSPAETGTLGAAGGQWCMSDRTGRRAICRHSHHPLTAPAVSPSIRKRRTTSENTRTGSITIVPPAAIRPHSQPA